MYIVIKTNNSMKPREQDVFHLHKTQKTRMCLSTICPRRPDELERRVIRETTNTQCSFNTYVASILLSLFYNVLPKLF